MLRETLSRILTEFPSARAGGDETFVGHPMGLFVRRQARDAVLSVAKSASPNATTLLAKGSVGDLNRWTHTPWIAVMDRRETDTVQEGVYVVYLFAADCEDVFLTVNQGCTTLYRAQERQKELLAGTELRRRAQVMRQRLPRATRLTADSIDLKGPGWRSRLYEAGTVRAVRYRASALPEESDLAADLSEALRDYAVLISAATWAPDDDVIEEASDAGRGTTLKEAKKYRQHRKIERSSKTAKKVKDAIGVICFGCDKEMGQVYGSVAAGYIEAHHLKPLSTYNDGEEVTLDPKKDFAVLCPNCHRVIHRMDDTSNIQALRILLGLGPK